MESVYEFTFLAEPASEYFCPVCTDLLTTPYLTDCGHHLCYTCRRRLLENQRVDCPVCREENVLANARLNKHFQRQVNSFQIRCKYHEQGCLWAGELKYLEEHLSNECKFTVVELTVTDFTRMKESNAEWVSPPFYSHPHGHKLRLAVYPNGLHARKGTDMSVCVLIDSLPMVFIEGSVGVELVNFRADYGLVSFISLNDVPNMISNTSTVIDYPHSSLVYDSDRNTEYLKDDSVRFKVSLDEEMIVFDYPTALLTKTPSWQISPSQPSLLEFTLPEFTQRMETLHPHYSCPDVYTHSNGYKFNLRISVPHFLFHRYVSVRLTLVAGEYDDQLEWPFVSDMVLELLNWREDSAHYEKTFSFNSVDKVTEDAGGEEIEDDKFISYSLLDFDPEWNTEYLHKDCLRFRVTMKQP